MRASKVAASERTHYPSQTTSKSSYTSELVSSATSTCVGRDKKKNAGCWSCELPKGKTALNTVIREAFSEVQPEKGDAAKKPAIIDLCDEDKRRIMNLVEELAKHVEEKRVLGIEVVELRSEVWELRGEAEVTAGEMAKHVEEKRALGVEVGELTEEVQELRGEAKRTAAERQGLQAELALAKREREALARKLEATASHRERLEEKLSARRVRNRDLERERSRLRSQLGLAKRKLTHAARIADICRADLRSAVQLLRRQGGRGEDAATQTGGHDAPPPPPFSVDAGAESLLLGELFFTSPGIPREMEPIFFLPAPFNTCPEDRDLWSFCHDRA